MNFSVKNKQGFYCSDPVLIILDEENKPFYFKNNEKGTLHFNLPLGNYSTNNKLFLGPVRNYDLKRLPAPTVRRELPKNGLQIVVCDNPHKCSIDTKEHLIIMDHSIAKAPKPIKEFVLGHELGHYFYANQNQLSEKKCDCFSYNKMINEGYNPSQIFWSASDSLSECELAKKRKNEILNLAKKSF